LPIAIFTDRRGDFQRRGGINSLSEESIYKIRIAQGGGKSIILYRKKGTGRVISVPKETGTQEGMGGTTTYKGKEGTW